MRRSLLRLWLGIGILGTVVVYGCNHGTRRCSRCATLGTPVPTRIVTAAPAAATVPRAAAAEPLLAVEVTPPATPRVSTRREEAPDLHRVARLDPPVAPEGHGKSTREGKPAPAEVPVSAYERAPDYSWLSGILEQGRKPNILLLRYAPADGNDRFGGSVTLVLDEDQAAGLRPGQAVRVEGALLDPDAGGSRPGYRVSGVKPLARPE